jgi:hypothetical protein
MSLRPTSELVAVAWLKGVTGIPSTAVATDLPADNSTWSASGFVQVMSVGGSPNIYVPVAQPVIQVDLWAVNPNSSKPPWGKANQLAESIRMGTLDHANVGRLLTGFPAAYNNARCLTVYPISEPRRIRDDSADFAHYTMDLQFMWIEVPLP